MRLLIYLLAMLTGFSAAEAARPAPGVPTPVDATAQQSYAAAAVKIAEQTLVSAKFISSAPFAIPPVISAGLEFVALGANTPVIRRDVILV
jgi:hypothetical protein